MILGIVLWAWGDWVWTLAPYMLNARISTYSSRCRRFPDQKFSLNDLMSYGILKYPDVISEVRQQPQHYLTQAPAVAILLTSMPLWITTWYRSTRDVRWPLSGASDMSLTPPRLSPHL